MVNQSVTEPAASLPWSRAIRARLTHFASRSWTLAVLVAGIELSYVYLVSVGTFTHWPTVGNFCKYDRLAEGFRSGHLYVLYPPAPELLARSNPYDPANRRHWRIDASLYKGHYYLYWGPVPAIGLAVIKTLFRIQVDVGEQYLLFVFYTVYLVSGSLLIARMARRLFPSVPRWLVAVSILVLAYGNPTPFLIVSPMIYATAVAGGQAFLLLGLMLAFEAVWSERYDARTRLMLAGAGLSWALAFGCRASTILSAAVIVLLTAVMPTWPRQTRRPWMRPIGPAIWMAAPIAAAVAGQLVYNKLRFDAWLDFGLGKMLTTSLFRSKLSYLLPNVYSYLLRPLRPRCEFPFPAQWDPKLGIHVT